MAKRKCNGIALLLTALWVFALPASLPALAAKPPNGWQDDRRNISPKFKKKARQSTRYIILHGSEAGLQSTLQTLSKGKQFKGTRYRTHGGHAHYLIDRSGRIYYLLDEKYRADHAGLSLWNGLSDLSSHSLGIELVAYVSGDITDTQYESLTFLLTTLRLKYKIPDKNILTHAHVAYGRPNPWFPRDHRGRKRDGINLDMTKLGLKEFWDHDPDVRSGRLLPDPLLAKILYSDKTTRHLALTPQVGPTLPTPGKDDIIRPNNTAWTIAGEEYDSPETVYILSGGREIRGDRVEKEIGWNRLPNGTRVLLNQIRSTAIASGPIHHINAETTAWSCAGPAYRASSTYYITPLGSIMRGDQVKDWDQIPQGTRMLIRYQPPKTIGALQGTTPWSMAGPRFNHPDSVYFIPPTQLIVGSEVGDFSNFPKGSLLFLPLK